MPRSDGADYAAVLADLREQRARLDAAIRALEAVMAAPKAPTQVPIPLPAAPASPALAPDFQGMTVHEAALRYLQSKGVGQRTTQILQALQSGGVALTGKSPINSLGAILNGNLKRHGQIVKLKRGVWGLSAWKTPAASGADGRHAPSRVDDQPRN
jgi:hypothetical protein